VTQLVSTSKATLIRSEVSETRENFAATMHTEVEGEEQKMFPGAHLRLLACTMKVSGDDRGDDDGRMPLREQFKHF
jgi:hypothetical protein